MSMADALSLSLWYSVSQTISPPGLPAPVQSFVDRAEITDETQIAAVFTLYENAVAHGWWDKCDLIYPFVGGTAAAHAQNLKSTSFTITWAGTVTHNANGITGDGASGYGDTGFDQSSGVYSLDSAHLGAYIRIGESSASTKYVAGAKNQGPSFTNSNPLTARIAINDPTPNTVTTTVLAWSLAVRNDNTTKHLFSGITDNSLAVASIAISGNPIFILALNNSGPAFGFTDANLAGLTVGSGMSFAEYTVMAADWQTFNTALGRQV